MIGRIMIVLTSVCVGCGSGGGSGSSVPKRDVKTVMEAHVDELMAIPGVTGVAIGALDDGTPCVMVLIVKRTDELRRRIPKTLEGHPVKTVVSGEIKPL